MMHISSLKTKTKELKIETLPDASTLFMPLGAYQSHMKPWVKAGDYVKKYQLIAMSDDSRQICLHSPVSGIVEGVVVLNKQSFLKVKNDFEETEDELLIPEVNSLSKYELLNIIRESGIVGSGGAGFPTHLKYRTEGYSITDFIINGAECEPFLSADYAVMKHESRKLLEALDIIQRLTASQNIVLAIEKQHKELKAPIERLSKELNLSLKVHLLENHYPQGGELQLIKAVTGKELPKGSIPARYGVVVSNVGTIYAISEAFFNKHPYVERIITVSGEKITKPGNYRVKIGTPVSHILECVGFSRDVGDQQIVLGGPMMGKAISELDEPVGKGTGGVLALRKVETKSYNCIQCGYCSDVCPQHLMPMEFVRDAMCKDISGLQRNKLDSCIECAACAYVCPSDVPLMESIKKGKQTLLLNI